MKKRNRTILFFFFVFLFFASIPAIVLYTQGYRIDFENFKLVETGGIALNIRPTNAEIFLNDTLEQQTNVIFRDAVFRNIPLGEYDIRIEKESYQTWQKTIAVAGKQVSKFDNIRLFPEALQARAVEKDIEKIAISPDRSYALVLKKTVGEQAGTTSGTTAQTSQIFLLQVRNGVKQPVYELAKGETLTAMQWADNSQVFYIHSKTARNQKIRAATVQDSGRLYDWEPFLDKNYPSIWRAPYSIIASNTPNVLFVVEKQKDGSFGLTRLRLAEEEVTKEVVVGITGFAISDDDIFYVDQEAILKKTNMFTGALDILNHTPLVSEKIKEPKVILRADEKALAVLHNSVVTLWQEDKPLERMGQDAMAAAFSPDNDKIAYWNTKSITVHWLDEVFGPPKRMLGDREVLDEFRGVQSVEWLENRSSHLLIELSNNMIVAELDPRGSRNIASFELDTAHLEAFDMRRQLIFSFIDNTLSSYSLE